MKDLVLPTATIADRFRADLEREIAKNEAMREPMERFSEAFLPDLQALQDAAKRGDAPEAERLKTTLVTRLDSLIDYLTERNPELEAQAT